MSESGGTAATEAASTAYQSAGSVSYSSPPSQPPTPSSTVQDPPTYANAEESSESKSNLSTLTTSNSGLPPFSSFSADVSEGLVGRLASDGYLNSEGISSTRVMELSGWDYCYTDGRYLERTDGVPLMVPQPQYRPWESKQDGSHDGVKSGLPSFQSQFGEELVTTLTTLTPAACSPAPSVPSPGLPSFHTLSAVNPRYPLVPAPVQAREIPSIQQQFLDERHIHLFQGAPGQNFANGTLTQLNNGTTLTTLNNAQYHINNAQLLPGGQIITPQSHILGPNSQILTSNGHIIASSGGQGIAVVSQNATPTVLTVVKAEPVNIVELKTTASDHSLTQLHHHPHFQNPLISQGHHVDSKFGMDSPPRGIDNRKKERRKIRASSLESSNESDGAMSVESSGQVAAVSSTAGFKSPMTPNHMNSEGDSMITDTGDKQTKKKRKRCGECIGCQRKDNCGDCAPCRNDKSHQICKMRRCEKLTEKKHLLAYNREDGGVSYRGRGRGRGGRGSRGGFRGKAPRQGSTPSSNSDMNSSPGLGVPAVRDSVKMESARGPPTPTGNPSITPTMQSVPFYPGGEVWPPNSTPAADPWTPQGQFIHQVDDIRYQPYTGYQQSAQAGYPQGSFISDQQQPSAFQPSYGNQSAASTSPAQGNVTPRPPSNYTQVHTPQPSPIGSNPPTPHVNGHRNGMNVHYGEDASFVNGSTFISDSSMAPPSSSPPTSRSNETSSDTPVSKANYMSGNEQPGYPANSPQRQSLCNSNGYPGQSMQTEYGDQINSGANNQQQQYQPNQGSPSYTSQPQPSPGYNQNYGNSQNYNHISPEQQSPSHKHYPQSSPKNYQPAPSPSYQMYETRQGGGNYFESYDKSNVNARIKTMIMNKQGRNEGNNPLASPVGQTNGNQSHLSSSPINGNSTDSRLLPDYNKKSGEVVGNESNHFLAFSHHLRDGSELQPEGGGYCWTGYVPASSINFFDYSNFNRNVQSPMQFGTDCNNIKLETNDRNQSNYQDLIYHQNYPTRRSCDFSLPKESQLSDSIKVEIKEEAEEEQAQEEEEEEGESRYPRVSYAPIRCKAEVIDRRFENYECSHWKEYEGRMKEERKLDIKKEPELYPYEGEGGPMKLECTEGAWCCRLGGIDNPTADHLRDGCCPGAQTADELLAENLDVSSSTEKMKENAHQENTMDCNCFPPEKPSSASGSYYKQLGAAKNLQELRKSIEDRLGMHGKSIRIEKIRHTGKEGKTVTGCPLAKWVLRRSGLEEKFLVIVKYRQGHVCATSWIVVCIVAWEGIPGDEADRVYNVLTEKLNKFGLPTTRRCATNEPRTCACQGIDPETCGTSFSFGCSWSMYYNGCKYARSKIVRKFRLSVKSEEEEVEERMHILATLLNPLYSTVAPEAFKNQTQFEREASECRLGFKPGRPFSGVTVCIDFCAHAHRDLHNMNNGCTAVVTLSKNRDLAKPYDEQLHVLPLYIMEETDEYGSKESQEEKYRTGSVERLDKFPCEVRVRAVPLQPCRRHGKKRKEEEQKMAGFTQNKMPSTSDHYDSQLQSSQVSSTVMDNSPSYHHQQDGRKNGAWLTGNNGGWDYIDRTVADADSTTIYNQPFSPCSGKSVGSYGYSSPLSSPMTPNSWYSSEEGISSNNEYPGSCSSPYLPSPPCSSPFRVPKSRPPSRQNATPDPFIRPHPKEEFADNNYYNYNQQCSGWYAESMKTEPLGEVTDYTDNEDCFRDPEMGGVGIALSHGSVLFEVAKQELHATTALKIPNRLSPTRISLVFYQHRNLNRAKHGRDEWEEKMRLKKMGEKNAWEKPNNLGDKINIHAKTLTTTTWTTMFPMKPCAVTGPYQEKVE